MDYTHHVIPKHEWKKRFGNLIGVNAPDNLVVLTLEQHTEIHQRYGEEGSKYDWLAYLRMSKSVGAEEYHRQLNVEAHIGTTYNRGRKHTPEQNRAKSERSKGNSRASGVKWTEERHRVMSLKMRGNTNGKGNKGHTNIGFTGQKHSEEAKRKISEARKLRTCVLADKKVL